MQMHQRNTVSFEQLARRGEAKRNSAFDTFVIGTYDGNTISISMSFDVHIARIGSIEIYQCKM